MKKILLILLAFCTTVLAVNANSISFPDVNTSDWFYDDVMNMVDWGVIEGNDDGTFKPGNNVNRAELSAMWNRYDEKVTADRTLEADMLRYSLIQSFEQNALLYQNLYSLYNNVSMGGNGSCSMIEYYYNMMEQNYTVAENLSNMMTYSDLQIDPSEYGQSLSDYRFINDECDF